MQYENNIMKIRKVNDMDTMKIYTEAEALDLVLGQKGSEAREQYEADMRKFFAHQAVQKTCKEKSFKVESSLKA